MSEPQGRGASLRGSLWRRKKRRIHMPKALRHRFIFLVGIFVELLIVLSLTIYLATRNADPITRSNFARIHTGMSLFEVDRVLGVWSAKSEQLVGDKWVCRWNSVDGER